MRYGFITFRSHPLDKNLDDYYLTLLQPLLKKSEKFLLGIDNKNTLEQHFHLIISGPDSMDITNLRSKFKTKTFNNFYKKIKDEQLSTYIDPKFQHGCMEIKMVEKSKDDEIKILGYCAKEYPHASKGYTEDEITDAIKYHYATERLDNSVPLENNWRVLTTRNAHAYLEDFSLKNGLNYSDPLFPIQLAKNKISMINISKKQQEQLYAELAVASNEEHAQPDETFSLHYYQGILQESNPIFYRELHSKYMQLLSFVESQNIVIPEKFTEY